MALLVTGGTGFLGAYFARHALAEKPDEAVVAFDKYLDRGRIADILDRVTVVEGDVADFDAVRAVVQAHQIDRIAHFAFILGSPSPGQMVPYVRVQSLGTAHVYEAARLAGVKRVLYCSSVAAYGKQTSTLLHEDLATHPVEPYGFSKVWGESLGQHYRETLGLEVVSLRFGSTYGLGRARRGSYASGLLEPPRGIHYMARVEEAVRDRPIEMPRDDAVADWTYAADAAQAAWLALTVPRLPHHLYNVGSERCSVGHYTRALRELLPAAEIKVSTADPAHPHPGLDTRRLRADLGFAPRYDLREGLIDYIERIRAYDRYTAQYEASRDYSLKRPR